MPDISVQFTLWHNVIEIKKNKEYKNIPRYCWRSVLSLAINRGGRRRSGGFQNWYTSFSTSSSHDKMSSNSDSDSPFLAVHLKTILLLNMSNQQVSKTNWYKAIYWPVVRYPIDRDIIKYPWDFSRRWKRASMLLRIVVSRTVSDSGENEFQRQASSRDIFR